MSLKIKLKEVQSLLYKCDLCHEVCFDFEELDLHVFSNHLSLVDGPRGKAEHGIEKTRSALSKTTTNSKTAVSTKNNSKTKNKTRFNCKYCLKFFKSDVSRSYHEKSHSKANLEQIDVDRKEREAIAKTSQKSPDSALHHDHGAGEIIETIDIADSSSDLESNCGNNSPKRSKDKNSRKQGEGQLGRLESNLIRFKIGNQTAYFRCKFCHKKLSKGTNAVNHILSHTGDLPFSCDTCPKSFKSRTSLTDHQNTHTGDKPFEFRHCFKRYHKHEKECSKPKTSSQEIAGHASGSVRDIKSKSKSKPIRRLGRQNQSRADEDTDADEQETHKLLTLHRNITRIETKDGKSHFECNICKKKSRHRSSALNHVLSHNTGILPFRC